MLPSSSKRPVDSTRIAHRYPFETRIKIRLLGRAGDQVVGGWARDISESGIGAFVAEELISEEEVELEVPFTEGVTLKLPARVSRNLGTQYGMVFTALSLGQRQHIQSAIAGKAPLPSPFLPKS
jgi:hypothetical protein